MKDDDFIISGFDGTGNADASFAVDFASAKLLKVGGSTCDVYECVVQRRRVFVKRLKAEYRDNPLYRAAFSKEYDLGVSLSHTSLPRYVGFGGDYIAMDFVEGDTLADLIARGDNRLGNKKFVKKLLLELIDVVEYLHYRNIIHCDIKADNIIISPYSDRPATLIDFDKAYSPWLDSTHGNAAKYDCEGCADGVIDFKGIGLIAGKLGFKRVADACRGENVNADSLKKLLKDKKYRWWIFAGVIAAIAAGAMILWQGDESQSREKETVLQVPATVTDTIQGPSQTPPAVPEPPSIDIVWIESLIARKSAEVDGYIQDLWQILDSDTVSIRDKQTAIMDYRCQSALAISQIIFSAVEKHRNISELEVQKVVRSHPAWLRLHKTEEEMDRQINEWNAKVSQ